MGVRCPVNVKNSTDRDRRGLSYVALEKHVLRLQSFKKYYSEFVFCRHEQANDSICCVSVAHCVTSCKFIMGN